MTNQKVYELSKTRRFKKLAGEEIILLKLRFTGNAASYVQEHRVGKADRLFSYPGGSLDFERKTTMSTEIMKWELCFGNEVDVIEPESLKKAIM